MGSAGMPARWNLNFEFQVQSATSQKFIGLSTTSKNHTAVWSIHLISMKFAGYRRCGPARGPSACGPVAAIRQDEACSSGKNDDNPNSCHADMVDTLIAAGKHRPIIRAISAKSMLQSHFSRCVILLEIPDMSALADHERLVATA